MTRIVLDFRRRGGAPERLEPLRLEREIMARFEGPVVIESAFVEAEVTLRGGAYTLPLSPAGGAELEISEGTQLLLTARLGRPPHTLGGPEAILSQVEGRFSQPLEFTSIFSTLTALHHAFTDAGLTALAARLPAGLKARALSLKRLVASSLALTPALLDQWAGEIALTRFNARPQWRRGAWHLQFSFSGYALIADRVRVPFSHVKLPSAILPTLNAEPNAFLAEPLASGHLHQDRVPHGPLASAMIEALSSASVQLRATAKPPELRLSGRTLNGGDVSAMIRPPQQLHLKGKGRVERVGEALKLEATDAQVVLGERRLDLELTAEAPAAMIGAAVAGEIPPGHVRFDLKLRSQSSLGGVETQINLSHGLALGVGALKIDLRALHLSGGLRGAFEPRSGHLDLEALDIPFDLDVAVDGGMSGGFVDLRPERLEGLIKGRLQRDASTPWRLEVEGGLDLKLSLEGALPRIPELGLETGHAMGEVAGALSFNALVQARAQGEALRFESDETEVRFELAQGALGLEGRRLTVPSGTTLRARLKHGELDTSGLGRLRMTVSWDMGAAGPIFSYGDASMDLLDPSLRAWALDVGISPSGRLTVEGARGGLYDSGFLNALLNPMAEKEKWLEIIDAPEPLKPLAFVLGSFSKALERALWDGHAFAARAKDVVESEGIKIPGDLLPAPMLARVAARLLTDDARYEGELRRLIDGVVSGQGLDWRAAERLIEDRFPEHVYRYEVDRVLRWLDRLLSPASPVAPPKLQRRAPLVEGYRFEGLPRAAEIYAWVEGEITPERAATLARLAVGLHLEMVEALLEAAERLPTALTRRLRYVQAIKRRARLINEGFGGFGFVPQAAAMAFFLGDVLSQRLPMHAQLGDGFLNPVDVATLMQAGQASLRYDRTVQINQRMLLDYLSRQPRVFVLGVFAEMGLNSPRILTSALLALLNQDQGQMKRPLDLPALFSKVLGTQIPRREDYLAGGRWARESYYQALMGTAEYALEQAAPYFAFKQWIGEHRGPAPQALMPTGGLAERAEALIKRADEVAARCQFSPTAKPRGPLATTRKAYEAAFAACRALIEAQPTAFQAPWFKAFWARNHEALMVRSVLRNVQEGVDEVPGWFAHHTHDVAFETEQALLEGVIEALYWDEADRARLKADPLVRLLLDPPEGRYDFTIVSAMGVVTDGAEGAELADAFERLEARYGVSVQRADTATAETLEYNAARVEEAIAQVKGPYGLIGYSQGCANVLMAERQLLSGTPKQRALIKRLRCRQLLFSAFNGSAHATASNQKMIRAVIDGERFLKHYQAVFSRPVIMTAHKVIFAAMDARPVARILGSVESISHEGVIPLHRDGQFLDAAPTTTIRGVAGPGLIPEALDMLANVFTAQVMGAPHDSQVTLPTTVGRSVQVENAYIDALARAEIPSMPQNTHHWSPLLVDTEFITTARDRAQRIYDGPKDRHLFPWVEVNARFGVIEVTSELTLKP